jgi:hypothetical protein
MKLAIWHRTQVAKKRKKTNINAKIENGSNQLPFKKS